MNSRAIAKASQYQRHHTRENNTAALPEPNRHPHRSPYRRRDHYRLELEDLARAVRGDGTPLLGRADALGQALMIEALLAS